MLQRIKEFLFKNESSRQTVAKNTFWLTVSNFGGRAIKAAVVIYAARVLGTAEWGLFSYAVTLAGFFTWFVDPGINGILLRDASSATEEKRAAVFSTTFAMKIVLIAIGALFILFVAPFFSTLPGAKALLLVTALILVFDSMREFLSALIRAMEKMEWEAGIFVLTNLSIVILGFIFLILKPTALSFGWAYVAGTAIGAMIAAFTLRRHFKNIFSHFSSALVAPILRSAWPFAVTGTLGMLLTNSDILIISWLRSASDVGVYSAALRIIQVLYLIPMVIQYTTLPAFSRLARKDDQKFRAAFERVLGTIFLISIPLALGGAILGTPIINLVFGTAYGGGSLSFKILMLTMLVDFPAMLIANALFAYDHQRSLIISTAIAGGANILFDLLLIPPLGITGSAIATLIAQTAGNWYLWHAMGSLNRFSVIPHLKKIIASGAIMGVLAGLLLAAHLNVVVNIIICIPVYFLLLKAFREPLLKEILTIIPIGRPAAEPAA